MASIFGRLLVALFVGLFAAATINEIAAHGLDPISLIAAVVTAMFAIGLISTFRNPQD